MVGGERANAAKLLAEANAALRAREIALVKVEAASVKMKEDLTVEKEKSERLERDLKKSRKELHEVQKENAKLSVEKRELKGDFSKLIRARHEAERQRRLWVFRPGSNGIPQVLTDLCAESGGSSAEVQSDPHSVPASPRLGVAKNDSSVSHVTPATTAILAPVDPTQRLQVQQQLQMQQRLQVQQRLQRQKQQDIDDTAGKSELPPSTAGMSVNLNSGAIRSKYRVSFTEFLKRERALAVGGTETKTRAEYFDAIARIVIVLAFGRGNQDRKGKNAHDWSGFRLQKNFKSSISNVKDSFSLTTVLFQKMSGFEQWFRNGEPLAGFYPRLVSTLCTLAESERALSRSADFISALRFCNRKDVERNARIGVLSFPGYSEVHSLLEIIKVLARAGCEQHPQLSAPKAQVCPFDANGDVDMVMLKKCADALSETQASHAHVSNKEKAQQLTAHNFAEQELEGQQEERVVALQHRQHVSAQQGCDRADAQHGRAQELGQNGHHPQETAVSEFSLQLSAVSCTAALAESTDPRADPSRSDVAREHIQELHGGYSVEGEKQTNTDQPHKEGRLHESRLSWRTLIERAMRELGGGPASSPDILDKIEELAPVWLRARSRQSGYSMLSAGAKQPNPIWVKVKSDKVQRGWELVHKEQKERESPEQFLCAAPPPAADGAFEGSRDPNHHHQQLHSNEQVRQPQQYTATQLGTNSDNGSHGCHSTEATIRRQSQLRKRSFPESDSVARLQIIDLMQPKSGKRPRYGKRQRVESKLGPHPVVADRDSDSECEV